MSPTPPTTQFTAVWEACWPRNRVRTGNQKTIKESFRRTEPPGTAPTTNDQPPTKNNQKRCPGRPHQVNLTKIFRHDHTALQWMIRGKTNRNPGECPGPVCTKRGIPGIEPGTSRTRSEHNATIPNPRDGMCDTVPQGFKYRSVFLFSTQPRRHSRTPDGAELRGRERRRAGREGSDGRQHTADRLGG